MSSPQGVGIKNTDDEIKSAVWADEIKPNGNEVKMLYSDSIGGSPASGSIGDKLSRLISESGSGTLNDSNTFDTITPTKLPTKLHVVFDVSNIANNGDDFTLEIKVGVSGSEKVVAYYKVTHDGTNRSIDTGGGTASVVKVERIDVSDIMVYTGEQVVVSRIKNSATDREVPYKYAGGV